MSEGAQGLDVVRMPAAAFGAMHRVLLAERGGLEAAQILRNMGVGSGGAFHTVFHDWLDQGGSPSPPLDELEPNEFWSKLSDFFAELGWGRLEHEEIHPAVVAITATDWIEAQDTANERGGCHFTTGVLADILRRVAGRELAAMEVECAATGSDCCRLLLGSPDALEAVFSRMREGAAYPEAVAALGA